VAPNRSEVMSSNAAVIGARVVAFVEKRPRNFERR
jgi:hypothetical protein